jgi:hypothetical protein
LYLAARVIATKGFSALKCRITSRFVANEPLAALGLLYDALAYAAPLAVKSRVAASGAEGVPW